MPPRQAQGHENQADQASQNQTNQAILVLLQAVQQFAQQNQNQNNALEQFLLANAANHAAYQQQVQVLADRNRTTVERVEAALAAVVFNAQAPPYVAIGDEECGVPGGDHDRALLAALAQVEAKERVGVDALLDAAEKWCREPKRIGTTACGASRRRGTRRQSGSGYAKPCVKQVTVSAYAHCPLSRHAGCKTLVYDFPRSRRWRALSANSYRMMRVTYTGCSNRPTV